MPVAIDAPTRSGSARDVDARVLLGLARGREDICAKRSIRRAALRSTQSVGSKSFSSQAKCTG